MAKTLINCDNCGNQFLRENKYLKRRKKYYCNRQCMSEGFKRGKTRSCKHCDKAFYAIRAHINQGHAIFCSRSCSGKYKNQNKGKNSSLYKDGSSYYRQAAFAHYSRCCRVCGYDTEPVLQVHHIDEDRSNNELDNLVILCPTHHKEAHLGLINIRLIHALLRNKS